MKKLGILKTDKVNKALSGQFGEYPEMFANIFSSVDPDILFKTYDVQEFEYPEDIEEVDAYMITGSAASVYDDLEWLHELSAFIKVLHERKKKIIGICFGHQLIAHILGGKTEKSNKGWGIGIHSSQLTELGKAFTGQQQDFNLFSSHQDQVIIPAENSILLASSEFCPIAMCKVGEHIFTTQGHIEMTLAYAKELINLRRPLYGEPLYNQALDSLHKRDDRTLITQWIINFIWGT